MKKDVNDQTLRDTVTEAGYEVECITEKKDSSRREKNELFIPPLAAEWR